MEKHVNIMPEMFKVKRRIENQYHIHYNEPFHTYFLISIDIPILSARFVSNKISAMQIIHLSAILIHQKDNTLKFL